jgi:hypothetical protein
LGRNDTGILLALTRGISIVVAFILVTLCIASGLYYISEFVEEHSQFSKRVLQRAIYVKSIVLYV